MREGEPRRIVLFPGYAELPSRQAYKPDRNSRLQVLAAAEMIRRGELATAYFLAGNISSDGTTGKDELGGIAVRMRQQLYRNLPHLARESSLVTVPTSMSTRQELRNFREILKVSNPESQDRLTVVGKNAHLERIKRAVRRTFGKRAQSISILSHEAILIQHPRQVIRNGHASPRYIDTLYQQIFEKIRNSPEEQGFIKRERIINLIDSVPLVGGLALDILNKLRIGKMLEARAHKAFSK
ncbi:MAG: YdcF family protein [Patescibacteria group bacterium]|nr:YdcF family protein [Patescibacteria group bacterium]